MTEINQPKISVYIAMSIDGYIARKDGSIDWLERGHVGDEDYGFKKFFNSIDALALGRTPTRLFLLLISGRIPGKESLFSATH